MRHGYKTVRESLQVDGMDSPLRHRIYNVLIDDFFKTFQTYAQSGPSEFEDMCRLIWKDYFERPIDEIPSPAGAGYYSGGWFEFFKKWYDKASFDEVYDFVEYVLFIEGVLKRTVVREGVQRSLEREGAGYRIVDDIIAPVTNEQELKEIEDALLVSGKFQVVQEQLRNALTLMSDRDSPDHRNSVKESISAVESMCRILADNPSATLGSALKEIERTHKLHPALKSAFASLYGYTSDAGGIRHGLLDDGIVLDQPDSKFMLVTCSAFVNYLLARSI